MIARCRFLAALGMTCALGMTAVCMLACDGQPRAHAATTTSGIVDAFGDTVRPPKRAERIVSLDPGTTEILFALGAGDRLVGRDMYSHWPDAAERVPSVGQGLRPNIEAVLARHPDLVFLYPSQDNRPAAQRLQQAGIAVAALRLDRIELFDTVTRQLGRLIGDSARGAFTADTVKRTLDSVRALTRSLRPVTVVMPVWDRPLIVIGGGSFLSQLVDVAGGRNIYDSLSAPSPTVTLEDVVRRNPDAVLVGPERAATIRRSENWRVVPAVRRGKVLVLDTSLVLRPAVRIGEGAVSLARLLHPELAH